MKAVWTAWAAALALAVGAARAGTAAIPGEDLFKWGEYDSLIRILEPTAVGSGQTHTHADSLARAKSLLFLGVAFCATGKTERADEVFSQAVELDPKVELDHYYVTEEIANRFQATALRALRRHPETRAAAASEPRPIAAPPEKSRSAPAQIAPSRHLGWVFAGMGTAAALAAVGGYYLFSDHGGGTRDDVTRIDLTRP